MQKLSEAQLDSRRTPLVGVLVNGMNHENRVFPHLGIPRHIWYTPTQIL